MVIVWRKLPILLNGIKPALFFVKRVKQNGPESEKKGFPRTSLFSNANSTYAA